MEDLVLSFLTSMHLILVPVGCHRLRSASLLIWYCGYDVEDCFPKTMVGIWVHDKESINPPKKWKQSLIYSLDENLGLAIKVTLLAEIQGGLHFTSLSLSWVPALFRFLLQFLSAYSSHSFLLPPSFYRLFKCPNLEVFKFTFNCRVISSMFSNLLSMASALPFTPTPSPVSPFSRFWVSKQFQLVQKQPILALHWSEWKPLSQIANFTG